MDDGFEVGPSEGQVEKLTRTRGKNENDGPRSVTKEAKKDRPWHCVSGRAIVGPTFEKGHLYADVTL